MSQSNMAATPETEQSDEHLSSEAHRLEALHRYAVLDSLPEENFDRIAEVASRQFKAPYAILSLVDEDRLWVKAVVGIDKAQTDRDKTFSNTTCSCARCTGR